MEVSQDTKNAYLRSSHKELSIAVDSTGEVISNSLIHIETMQLTESIFDSDSIEFVGCISSEFEITVNSISTDLKNKSISVSIIAGGTETIPLFHGVVDSVKKSANRNYKTIKAYDVLYSKGQRDIASWYNGLRFPITLKAFRDSLFAYLGITQVEKVLPNDGLSFGKQYNPTALQAISVIKAVCQINGAFGIINRDGKFEYRILPEIAEGVGTFPGADLFPPFFLGDGSGEYAIERIESFKSCQYEDFSVKPVDKLTIRQTDTETGVSYGTGENNYIIQGNMFTAGKTGDEILQIARNIYPNIAGISYTPFTALNDGLPWVECGKNIVKYHLIDFEKSVERETKVYVDKQFYVFTRTLTGIQALKDEYRAEGEEYQREFITDLQTQIETIKQNIADEVSSAVENHDYTEQFNDYYEDYGLKAVSVLEVPSDWDSNTIYFIQE